MTRELTLLERIERRQDNPTIVPIVERRKEPRWIEYTRQNEKRGKALDQWGGQAA